MAKQMLCPRCWGSKKEPGSKSYCNYCKGLGVAMDQLLSPHFYLSEFLVSQTAVRLRYPNDPNEVQLANLRSLAVSLMEPVRNRFGPIHVNSGLRQPLINASIGGSSRRSAHMDGSACDFRPFRRKVKLKDIVDWVISSDLIFDQIIFEGTWVHIGEKGPKGIQRKQKLMMFPTASRPKYYIYNPKDPRVQN